MSPRIVGRKITSIASAASVTGSIELVALCEDGTLWRRVGYEESNRSHTGQTWARHVWKWEPMIEIVPLEDEGESR